MNGLASEFLNTLIIAMVPVIITGLGWLARALVNYIKSRTSAEQYALLEAIARQAVSAVEQTMKTEAGVKKRAAAIAYCRSALLSRGIKLDEEAIGNAVEAAVYANVFEVPPVK